MIALKKTSRVVGTLALAALFTVPAMAQVDRSKAPEAGPAPEIKLGEYASFTLDNGLKVFVIENHKLPRVSYQLLVDYDPIIEGDKAGYVQLAGSLLRNGTTNRTKGEIDEAVDFIGGSLSTSSNGIYASSLTKHQDKLLELASDVLLNPVFPEDELEKARKQTLSSLAQNKNDANAMAGTSSYALRYGHSHPYGEPTTEETVAALNVDDCKNFYNTYFRPNVSYLVIVGDINKEEAEPIVKKYFGAWEKADVPTHVYRTPKAPEGCQVAIVNKPGAVQSVVNVTYPVDLKPGGEDVIAAKVMNNILGGGVFSGRLMQNLREDKAFTYGASSSLKSDKLVGSFTAYASVRNEVTDSAVTEFLYEMRRMVSSDVDEADLSLAKNSMNGSFARSLESPQTIAKFALNIERYGMDKDYYANYLKKLDAVSVEDVRRVAERYITPNNAHVLVVGNSDEIADKLAQFDADGEVTFYDMYGNVAEMERKAVPKGVSAQLVINNYLKAAYGEDPGKKLNKKLGKIKDISIYMSMEMQGQQISMVNRRKAPNMFSMVVKMGDNIVQKQIYDGKTGSSSGMMGASDMEGEELEEMKYSSTMFAESKYAELGYELQLLGIEPVEGSDAYVMTVTSPTGQSETVYYDVASGLKVRSISTQESPMGTITATTDFLDYKEVDGVKFPHRIKQDAGMQQMDMMVEKIELNTGVKADIFKK